MDINKSKQEIKNVKTSNINQAGGDIIVNQGLTYQDVVAIFQERISSANIEQQQRMIDFEQRIEKQLQINHLNNNTNFNDPFISYTYIQAQLGAVLTYDENIREILARICIDTIKNKNNDSIKILCNQAIEIAYKLNEQQFNLLTIIWLVFYNRNFIEEYNDINSYLNNLINNFINLSLNNFDFEYLSFLKCLQIRDGGFIYPDSKEFIKSFSIKFAHNFKIPLSETIINSLRRSINNFEELNFEDICYKDDKDSYFFNFNNIYELAEFLKNKNIPSADKEQFFRSFNNGIFSYDKLRHFYEQYEEGKILIEIFEKFIYKITPVGKILAIKNFENTMNIELNLSEIIYQTN